MVDYIHKNIDPSLQDTTPSDAPPDQDVFDTSLSFTDWRSKNVEKQNGYEMVWLMIQEDVYSETCKW